MLTKELCRGAESATETIRPSGLAVTNRLVMLALMEVTGKRGACWRGSSVTTWSRR
ncbi:hypothetical protein [Methanopyrus kandleri]|uniref:Uncharacterized protein n=1 Tax=Methanopyrus kandleri TaxID=2320 RepID=A0A832WAJ3_9EURY|nr:hypothetical protein [Methanopyrus kandleri]HII70143.1 hypothetical protein [Methanopyrus kandleri]